MMRKREENERGRNDECHARREKDKEGIDGKGK